MIRSNNNLHMLAHVCHVCVTSMTKLNEQKAERKQKV